jgi:RNA polymerase sigma-70 factor (TIGR02960 family)
MLDAVTGRPVMETPARGLPDRSAAAAFARGRRGHRPARHNEQVSGTILERARSGDEQAFRELTAPYLRELHVHCYRMLGSLTDADDLLQETLIAAWRGLDGYAGRASVRTWLYRIATNRCLNAIRDARRRIPAEPVPPFPPPAPSRHGDVTWLHPYPGPWLEELTEPGPEARLETRQSVELAFVTVLQRLPPRQSAALVLVDAIGFSVAEVAGMLASTPVAIKAALQRARAAVARDYAGRAHEPAGGAGSHAEKHLVQRFARSYLAGDIDDIVALLTDDAWLSMPPAPHEYHGRDAVAAFLRASAQWRAGQSVLLPAQANGQPALGHYLPGADASACVPVSIIVLTMSGDRLRGITHFLDAGLARYFRLPARLAPPGGVIAAR